MSRRSTSIDEKQLDNDIHSLKSQISKLTSELKRRGYKVWSTNTMSIFVFFNNEKETDEMYNRLNNNNICTKKRKTKKKFNTKKIKRS